MVKRKARLIYSYLTENLEGNLILHSARKILAQNNIILKDDDSIGIKSLILSHALYPNQLIKKTGGLTINSSESLDFCGVLDNFCKDNKGISRFKMPVIEGKNLHLVLENLQNGFIDYKNIPINPFTASYYENEDGDMIEVNTKNLPKNKKVYKYHQKSSNGDMIVEVKGPTNIVSTILKPTQKEISFDKAFSIAFNYCNGEYPDLVEYNSDSVVLVSKEGYIIDGHHRWAAIALLNRYSKKQILSLVNTKDTDKLLNFLADEGNDPKIKQWFKDNKFSDENKDLGLSVIIIDLPLNVLLNTLNACTDSLGEKRKPFNSKDDKKVVDPKTTNNYKLEILDIGSSITDREFKKQMVKTKEYKLK